MKRLIIVLGGLAALVYAASAGMQWLTPRVEEDLANRVNVSLAEQGLLWADVGVEGREVTLSGIAPSGDSRDKALDAASRVFGVAKVNDKLLLADTVTVTQVVKGKAAKDAYKVTLSKKGEDITLSGNVPDEQSLDVLSRLAVTHYGEEHVSNTLTVKAANAPAGWRSATGTVLFNMTNLEEAEATLSGGEIMISGTVIDQQFKDQITTQLSSTLPDNYKLGLAVDVVTPTEVVEVTEVAVVETPSVTTETTAPVSETAKVAAKEEKKAEEKKAKEEAKVAISKAEPSETKQVAAVSKSDVDEPTDAGILARVEAFMNGSKSTVEPAAGPAEETVKDNRACNSTELAMHKVYFDFDKTEIKDVYKPTITKVATLVPACAAVEVAGFTDSTGSELYNQWLSEQRAQSAMRALMRAGADKDKLVAKGYGVNSPIAPNGTKAGRSQNRRVEFKPTDAKAVSATVAATKAETKVKKAEKPSKTEVKAEPKAEVKAEPKKSEVAKKVTDTKVENPAVVPSVSMVSSSASVVEVISASDEKPWWERFRVAPVTPTTVSTSDVTVTAK